MLSWVDDNDYAGDFKFDIEHTLPQPLLLSPEIVLIQRGLSEKNWFYFRFICIFTIYYIKSS